MYIKCFICPDSDLSHLPLDRCLLRHHQSYPVWSIQFQFSDVVQYCYGKVEKDEGEKSKDRVAIEENLLSHQQSLEQPNDSTETKLVGN